MMGADGTVSVIVPSYRRPADLRHCLDAIADQTERPMEVLVVLRREDAEGRAAALAAGIPELEIVRVDRPGQVAALNAGREAAQGEILAITDDDARPRPEWVQRIRERFASDPGIGGVGGRDIVHHVDGLDDGVARHVGRVRWFGRHEGRHHFRSDLQDVDFLKGANMSYRAAALEPFDERLWGSGAQVCNDLEASLSVRRRGWRLVYDPAVLVDHFPAVRFDDDGRAGRSLEAARAEQHNELYALLRHRPTWQRPLLAAYRLLIGYRVAPGLAWTAVRVGQGCAAGEEARRLAALTTARLAAIRTWRHTGPPRGHLAP